jgi:putative heme-binding domain-containing protein
VVNELIATPTNALLQTVVQARNAVIAASLSDLANAAAVQNSVAELISAELALANGRADAFARVQASAARLNAQQIGAFALAQATATPAAAAGGRGGGGGGRGAAAPTVADRSRIAVADAPSIEQYLQLFVQTAGAMDGQRSQLADTVLLELANRRIGAPGPIQAAMRALDAGWSDPRRRIQIMMAAIDADNAGRANQIVAAMDDADPAVASVARYAVQQLAIDPEQLRARATQPKISSMSVATVLDAVATGGNPIRGGRLLNEVGCLACHTVSADDQPRGPFLGAIADILQRRELAEAILDPNRTISQGFATNAITLTDNSAVAGFVVREGGGNITIRTILGQEQRIPVANIASRVELETSLMPAGLVNDLTVGEFQDMLAYLESLANP